MKYGFVTFERPCEAFKAIDCGGKNPDVNHYDISFGGRRAFCKEKYLDLGKWMVFRPISRVRKLTTSTSVSDNTDKFYGINNPNRMGDEDDSFEALLRKVKEKLNEPKK